MDWGGPEFVLAIIAMGTFGGILKMAIRARHGLPPDEPRRSRRARRGEVDRLEGENAQLVDRLRDENGRLTSRLEIAEDRLIVLEKIVTDRGYTLASEIEALRDKSPARERLAARDKERNS